MAETYKHLRHQDSPNRRQRANALVLLLICLLLVPLQTVVSAAETAVEAHVNVPYVVQFGFGSYSVGGLSTDTFRIPITHHFVLSEGEDPWQLRFTGYLGYSHATFNTDLLGPHLTASQDYLFVLPQAELLIPLQQGWTLKPYLSVGAGWAFNGSAELAGVGREQLNDSYDVLYAAGCSTLFELPLHNFRLNLGSKLGWAEAVPTSGSGRQGFATFQNGLEVRHPLGIRLVEQMLDIAGSFMHYHFFPAARFSIPGEQPLAVAHQYEFGINLGFDKPAKLWIFDNPRIGASYRFGDGLTGFRVNFGFPF